MADNREERQARRAQKYAEVRQRLEAEMKASTDFIFGNGPPAQHRERRRDNDAAAQGFAANHEAFAQARAANRNALAVLNGIQNAPPELAPPAARGNVTPNRVPPQARYAANRNQQRARQDRAAAPEPTYVACPACFLPVLLAEMETHAARECAAIVRAQPEGGVGADTASNSDKHRPEQVEVGAAMQQAEEGLHGREARREAAAAAALRRAEQSAMEKKSDEEREVLGGADDESGAGAAVAEGVGEEGQGQVEEDDQAGAGAEEDEQGGAGAGRCVICMEENGEGGEAEGRSGVWCAGGKHFTCSVCLEGHVRTQAEDLAGLRERGGRVRCPLTHHGCTEEYYAHTEIGRHVSEAVFALYMRGIERAVEARVVEEVERHLAVRSRAAVPDASSAEASSLSPAAAGARTGPTQQQLEALRHHIVDRILTLACPRCSQAFVDFDGCCALSCPRCKCAFCAYCLEDCGGDAHAHVGRCQWNPRKEVFARKERFDLAQHQRRLRMLRAFLASLPPAPRAAVLHFCARELADLHIAPDDLT